MKQDHCHYCRHLPSLSDFSITSIQAFFKVSTAIKLQKTAWWRSEIYESRGCSSPRSMKCSLLAQERSCSILLTFHYSSSWRVHLSVNFCVCLGSCHFSKLDSKLLSQNFLKEIATEAIVSVYQDNPISIPAQEKFKENCWTVCPLFHLSFAMCDKINPVSLQKNKSKVVCNRFIVHN